MVSAPNIETVPRFTQMLHQCETLKQSICGKSLEVTSILMDEFIFRQNLENLYKSILLSDVQFALDNKVELELWNNAFKDHIDNFRLIIKEKKNTSERSEIQAKLFMFLDASIGFYFQLLQEFCDKYDLDLPYHGKPRQLGILTKTKKVNGAKKPKLDSCLYICQDCLVHLGDLARYRNEMQQAYAFYLLAAKILPGNGQPYNQLAILASARNDMLYAVFYYCKSISVPNPFPAAASNLQKTFAQASAKYSYNVLGKSTGLTVDEFIGLFINLSGCTYLSQDMSKLDVLKNKVQQDFNKMLNELKQHQVILITGICIFNLQKSRAKNMENIPHGNANGNEEEMNIWSFMLQFCVSILQLFLENTVDLLQTPNTLPEDLKCLPGIKMFTDWIVCNTIGLLEGEHFQGNVELFQHLALLGNELQSAFPTRDKSLYPLVEDWELHGMSVLQKVHRRYDFRIQPLDMSEERMCNLRTTRILRFLDWLTKHKQTCSFFTKKETENVSEYVCTMVPKQQHPQPAQPQQQQQQQQDVRCKSPFSEKSMSLFRTDSEECGMNEIPSVQGPVASYSLFDSMWKSTLHQSPESSVSMVTTSSPLVPISRVTGILEDSIVSPMSEKTGKTGPIGMPKPHVIGSKQKQHHPRNSPIMEEVSPTHSANAPLNNKPAKSVQISGVETTLFPKSIASSPHKIKSGSPLPQSNDGSPIMPPHIPEQQQQQPQQQQQQSSMKGIPPSNIIKEEIPPVGSPIPNPLHALPLQNPLLHAPPPQFQAQPPMKIVNQQQQQQQQQRHQEILLAGNLFLSKQLDPQPKLSNRLPDNAFHPTLIPAGSLDPSHAAVGGGLGPNHAGVGGGQFATHPPNFGVIGQNMRAPPNLQRSPFLASQFGPLPPPPPHNVNNILAANAAAAAAHQAWVTPPPRLVNNNVVVENRSIWSSNYAIGGQGELSPLEQLLQEQRRHQRPK